MWYMRDRRVRGFSDRCAAFLSPAFTPNLLSAARILLAVPMAAAFAMDAVAAGAALFLLSAFMDFLDGGLARYQDVLIAAGKLPPVRAGRLPVLLRSYGGTKAGIWLDPLSDKVAVWAALASLGWNALPRWLLLAGLGLALLLTLARPIKSALGLGEGKANAFGKMKMWTESATVLFLCLRPVFGDGSGAHRALATAGLALAVVLAGLSLIFQFIRKSEKTP